ncbi:hypothetical protein CU048_14445 [Beijerinckiaceae bacterium]|nr:hypothetical protein CU048_14445 [Beijerinckiaceae bacterium]
MTDFFDQNMLQLVELERFLFDQMIPQQLAIFVAIFLCSSTASKSQAAVCNSALAKAQFQANPRKGQLVSKCRLPTYPLDREFYCVDRVHSCRGPLAAHLIGLHLSATGGLRKGL